MSTRPTSETAAPAETPDTYGAYPRLDDAQLAAIAGFGSERAVSRGEVLVTEGDRNCDFRTILDGHVATIEGYGTPAERIIAVHGRGRFLGELGLLTGEASFYSTVAMEPGRVLVVAIDRLRDLVSHDAGIR